MSRRIVQCAMCGLQRYAYGRGLCSRCYRHAKLAGTLHEFGVKVTVQQKIREEWDHFSSILGVEGAVFRLAKAFEVDEVTVRKAVENMERVAA